MRKPEPKYHNGDFAIYTFSTPPKIVQILGAPKYTNIPRISTEYPIDSLPVYLLTLILSKLSRKFEKEWYYFAKTIEVVKTGNENFPLIPKTIGGINNIPESNLRSLEESV